MAVLLAGCSTSLELDPPDEDAGRPDDAADAAVDVPEDPPLYGDGGLDVDAGPPPPEPPEDPPEPPDAPEPPDPPAGPVERTYRVIHWNVAGAKIHRGRTDTGLIQALVRAIEDHGAHFVGLNELCRSQFDALAGALRARGWPRDPDNFARFVVSRRAGSTPGSCGAVGNGIFSRPPLGAAARFELPSDGAPESRYLICAPVIGLRHMRFCTTHLTFRLVDGHNRRQLRALFRHLEDYHDQGHTVILTGDLNVEPDRETMDAVYAPGVNTRNNRNNTGFYRELDDADPHHCPGYGEATGRARTTGPCGTGRKIDYIFVRRNRIVRDDDPSTADYSADSRNLIHRCGAGRSEPCSDHRMLTGRVRVRVER